MKFLSMYKSVERGVPPSQEEMAKMGKLVEEGFKAGWLLATEGCLPSALGARVRNSSGKLTVTDGPFTEAKEVVGGFAILRANSKEEVIQLTKDFLKVAGDGECEIRQIFEADKNLDYGKVLDAMDVAAHNGVTVTAMITDQRPGTASTLAEDRFIGGKK